MPTSFTNRTTSSVLLGIIVLLLGYQSFAYRQQQAPPTAVATFDLEKTFNTIDLKKAEFDKIPAIADSLQKEIDRRRKEIEGMATELEILVKGTQKYKDLEEKLALATQEYRAEVEFNKIKIESENGRTLKKVYLDIRKAAKQFAESRGYQLILVDDSATEIPMGTLEDLNRQISARRVVYTAVDVTNELIEFMNAEFKKSGGIVGAANTRN